jgi:hypothetical protein
MKFFRSLASTVGLAIATSSTEAAPSPPSSEQAVVVRFNYGSTDLNPLFTLEDRLETAIKKAGAGEYDGNEIATSGKDGSLYMYGPSADRLYAVVEPIFKSVPFMRGAKVTKRYGPPKDGVKEVTIVIEP